VITVPAGGGARGHPLAVPVGEFLGDLVNAGRSPHTVRGYRGNLAGFAAAQAGAVGQITVAVLRGWLASLGGAIYLTRGVRPIALDFRCCHRWPGTNAATPGLRSWPGRPDPTVADIFAASADVYPA
jgi:hypothetical protein